MTNPFFAQFWDTINMYRRLVTNKCGQVERIENKGICPVMDQCGVCSSLNLVYANQLSQKTAQLKQQLQSMGHPFSQTPVKACVESPEHLGWCVSTVLDVESSQDERGRRWTKIGYKHSGHVVDIERCPIQTSFLNDIVAWLRTGIRVHNIPVYSERKRTGLLSRIGIKTSRFSKKSVVTFVVTNADLPVLKTLARDISEKQTSVSGVFYQLHKPGKSIEKPVLLVGKDEFEEKYGNFIFSLPSDAVIPKNQKMMEQFWNRVASTCALTPQQSVLFLNDHAHFTALPRFLSQFTPHVLDQMPPDQTKVDVVVAEWDHKKTQANVSDILNLDPKKILFLSSSDCMPMDAIKACAEKNYRLVFAEPYDLAPGSNHSMVVWYLCV